MSYHEGMFAIQIIVGHLGGSDIALTGWGLFWLLIIAVIAGKS